MTIPACPSEPLPGPRHSRPSNYQSRRRLPIRSEAAAIKHARPCSATHSCTSDPDSSPLRGRGTHNELPARGNWASRSQQKEAAALGPPLSIREPGLPQVFLLSSSLTPSLAIEKSATCA